MYQVKRVYLSAYFDDNRFELSSRQPGKGRSRNELVEIEVAGENIIAEKKAVKEKGREYVALSFKHTLVPRVAGAISLPPGSLTINAFQGYSQSRSGRFGSGNLR